METLIGEHDRPHSPALMSALLLCWITIAMVYGHGPGGLMVTRACATEQVRCLLAEAERQKSAGSAQSSGKGCDGDDL
jgi:hypothetical protein